ncbi:unnamed protein product [Symbiodinium sp. CCMP2456]|nr:unnamed protein product [Symbiodinium sp. CCMP2456]
MMKSQVVDCVPFLMQPGLLWASDSEKQLAMDVDAEQSTGDEGMDEYGCKADEIPLPRPNTKALEDGLAEVFRKTAKSRDPSAPSKSDGYHYSLTPTYYNVSSDKVHVIAGVGPGIAPIPVVPPTGDHTLNQLWWITRASPPIPVVPPTGDHTLNQLWWISPPLKGHNSTYDRNGYSNSFVSLETGWMRAGTARSGSSSSSITTIFVFSTPDTYTDGCSDGRWGRYDHWGGFIVSKSPAAKALSPGLEREEVSFKFEYKRHSSHVELKLTPFQVNNNSAPVFGKEVHVGHYPINSDRYCWGFPTDGDWSLQVGLEMEANYFPESGEQTVSGKIYSWGPGDDEWQIHDMFSGPDYFHNNYSTYSQNPEKWAVTFSGTYTGQKARVTRISGKDTQVTQA